MLMEYRLGSTQSHQTIGRFAETAKEDDKEDDRGDLMKKLEEQWFDYTIESGFYV